MKVIITGDKALAAKFTQISAAVQSQVINESLDKGAEKAAELASERAPADRLREMEVRKEGLERHVGPVQGWLARWFELGTGPRQQKRTGRYTGRMQKAPFLRPSLEDPQVEQAAVKEFSEQMRRLGAW